MRPTDVWVSCKLFRLLIPVDGKSGALRGMGLCLCLWLPSAGEVNDVTSTFTQKPEASTQPPSMRAEADRSGTCEKYETIKLSLGTETQPQKPPKPQG